MSTNYSIREPRQTVLVQTVLVQTVYGRKFPASVPSEERPKSYVRFLEHINTFQDTRTFRLISTVQSASPHEQGVDDTRFRADKRTILHKVGRLIFFCFRRGDLYL